MAVSVAICVAVPVFAHDNPTGPEGIYVPGTTAVPPSVAEIIDVGGAIVGAGGRLDTPGLSFQGAYFSDTSDVTSYGAGYVSPNDIAPRVADPIPEEVDMFGWADATIAPAQMSYTLKTRSGADNAPADFSLGADAFGAYVFTADYPDLDDAFTIGANVNFSITGLLTTQNSFAQLGVGVQFYDVSDGTLNSPLGGFSGFVSANELDPFVQNFPSQAVIATDLGDGLFRTEIDFTLGFEVDLPQDTPVAAIGALFTGSNGGPGTIFESDSSNSLMVDITPSVPGSWTFNLVGPVVPEPALIFGWALPIAALRRWRHLR
ncbi:MAG: hypothetical protein AAGD32_13970 [Planctomycetota bacterium]